MTDIGDQLAEALLGVRNPVDEKVTTATFRGRTVPKVRAAGGNFAYIALDGPPYPLLLHLEGTAADESVFTETGSVEAFTEPDYEYDLTSR